MIDPFSSNAVGCRVPSLNPIDTYTHVQFDSFALSNQQMAPNGKILLVFNPTAILVRPVAILSDVLGKFNSFSTPAGIAKNQIMRMPLNINDSAVRNLAIWTSGTMQIGANIWENMSAPVDPLFTQLEMKAAGKVRLVSAGIRLFKTSTAISEAGSVRVSYRPRGGVP